MEGIPRQKGVYSLLFELPKKKFIPIGKLGGFLFKPGFYAYIGSAQCGLRMRLKRHINHKKKNYWHIDYLTEKTRIQAIVFSITAEKIECKVAQVLSQRLSCFPGFGVSDCDCESHLYYCPHFEKLKKEVMNAFSPSLCMFIEL